MMKGLVILIGSFFLDSETEMYSTMATTVSFIDGTRRRWFLVDFGLK